MVRSQAWKRVGKGREEVREEGRELQWQRVGKERGKAWIVGMGGGEQGGDNGGNQPVNADGEEPAAAWVKVVRG